MGALFSGAPKPPSVPMPPPAAHPAILASTLDTGLSQAKGAAAAEGMGMDNTIKTNPQGLQAPKNTAKATLLGQ